MKNRVAIEAGEDRLYVKEEADFNPPTLEKRIKKGGSNSTLLYFRSYLVFPLWVHVSITILSIGRDPSSFLSGVLFLMLERVVWALSSSPIHWSKPSTQEVSLNE